jgi:hypothetical protein
VKMEAWAAAGGARGHAVSPGVSEASGALMIYFHYSLMPGSRSALLYPDLPCFCSVC